MNLLTKANEPYLEQN